MGQTITNKHDYFFSIMLLGDVDTGKSALMYRIRYDEFNPSLHQSTIGMDFSHKLIKYEDKATIKLHLWDTSGQKKYRDLTKNVFKDTHAIFICFTLGDEVSYQKALDEFLKFAEENKNKNDEVPIYLIATKSDLYLENLKTEHPNDYATHYNKELSRHINAARKNGFQGFYACSAKAKTCSLPHPPTKDSEIFQKPLSYLFEVFNDLMERHPKPEPHVQVTCPTAEKKKPAEPQKKKFKWFDSKFFLVIKSRIPSIFNRKTKDENDSSALPSEPLPEKTNVLKLLMNTYSRKKHASSSGETKKKADLSKDKTKPSVKRNILSDNVLMRQFRQLRLRVKSRKGDRNTVMRTKTQRSR